MSTDAILAEVRDALAKYAEAERRLTKEDKLTGRALRAALEENERALFDAPRMCKELVVAIEKLQEGAKLSADYHDVLARFFREEEVEWGNKGDYEGWSPTEAAIRLIRHLRGKP